MGGDRRRHLWKQPPEADNPKYDARTDPETDPTGQIHLQFRSVSAQALIAIAALKLNCSGTAKIALACGRVNVRLRDAHRMMLGLYIAVRARRAPSSPSANCGDPAESMQIGHSGRALRCGGSSPKNSHSILAAGGCMDEAWLAPWQRVRGSVSRCLAPGLSQRRHRPGYIRQRRFKPGIDLLKHDMGHPGTGRRHTELRIDPRPSQHVALAA